jgi:hypothetical protein
LGDNKVTGINVDASEITDEEDELLDLPDLLQLTRKRIKNNPNPFKAVCSCPKSMDHSSA